MINHDCDILMLNKHLDENENGYVVLDVREYPEFAVGGFRILN
jgi:rhodanese-related sulfurtransferase